MKRQPNSGSFSKDKPKPGPGAPITRSATTNLNVRCSVEFKELVKALAKKNKISQAELLEYAVKKLL